MTAAKTTKNLKDERPPLDSLECKHERCKERPVNRTWQLCRKHTDARHAAERAAGTDRRGRAKTHATKKSAPEKSTRTRTRGKVVPLRADELVLTPVADVDPHLDAIDHVACTRCGADAGQECAGTRAGRVHRERLQLREATRVTA